MKSYTQVSFMVEKPAADVVIKGLEELICQLTYKLTSGISYQSYGVPVSEEKIAHIVAFSNQIEAIHSLIRQVKEEFSEDEAEEAIPF